MTARTRPAGLLVKASMVLLLVLLVAAVVGVARAGASSSPVPAEKVTLHIGWVQEPDNLNPFIGIQGTDYMLWHMNYDFLVGFDAKTLEPRPELATAWEVSPDGKVWTFTIRGDSKWQDGVPVTARDVAFTFNYINDNQLLNLSTYTNGITKAEVVDDTHVKIYTKAPKANMLRMVVPILPEHIWSKVTGKEATTSYQNKPPIVGDGPFQVVEWKKGKFVRLAANPTYWGGKPKVDEVILELYTNPDTMAQDLKLGTLDGAVDIPPAQFKPLNGQDGITTSQSTSWNFIELAMNSYDSPGLQGQSGPQGPAVPHRRQLGRRPPEGRRRGLPAVRHARLVARRAVLQVPLGAAGRRGVRLRPGEGQADPRRRGLQGRQRRRLPRDQGRQEARPALLRHHRLHAEPDRRQAHRRLAQGRRHQAGLSGHRLRRAHQLPVRVHRQHLHARLGHVHLVLGRGRRPQLHHGHLHAPADRGLERLPVDRPRSTRS